MTERIGPRDDRKNWAAGMTELSERIEPRGDKTKHPAESILSPTLTLIVCI
jgi:hypothetical protein